jgi:hypothetical protein
MHTDVQALLKSKNRCLTQLIRLTAEVIQASPPLQPQTPQATLDALQAIGELLPKFDKSRADIFRAIELVDHEIRKVAPAELREQKPIIEEQQRLVASLQTLDSRLLENFESLLNSGPRIIQQQVQAREKINRFKSGAPEAAGEALDQKL